MDVDVKFASTREGGLEKGVLRMVLDGYNAPVTAGNFLDLVNRKFYDGMEVQRADGFVVQTGNPGGEVGPIAALPWCPSPKQMYFRTGRLTPLQG